MREVLEHMSIAQLIDTILINPTVHISPSYRDTGLHATYTFKPLSNLVYTRDQQVPVSPLLWTPLLQQVALLNRKWQPFLVVTMSPVLRGIASIPPYLGAWILIVSGDAWCTKAPPQHSSMSLHAWQRAFMLVGVSLLRMCRWQEVQGD